MSWYENCRKILYFLFYLMYLPCILLNFGWISSLIIDTFLGFYYNEIKEKRIFSTPLHNSKLFYTVYTNSDQ